jgi:hypothetical protein
MTEKISCECGRSPLGRCIGLHKLTEDEFNEWLKAQHGPTGSEGEE